MGLITLDGRAVDTMRSPEFTRCWNDVPMKWPHKATADALGYENGHTIYNTDEAIVSKGGALSLPYLRPMVFTPHIRCNNETQTVRDYVRGFTVSSVERRARG